VQFGQTLAAAGSSVLLVDLDLTRPRLAQALGVTPDRDLVGAASGERPQWSPRLAIRGHAGLSYIAAMRSARGINADELEGSLQELLYGALDEFAYVLLDAPPLAEVSDALKLASVADAVVMVVRLGSTTVTDLEVAGDLLERTGRHNAGCIVVGSQHP
jgi:polysaccharide biosynthesis transport protein